VRSASGGERRRIALAQLLVASPDVAILDEPTNHLDADTIEWLETTFADDFRGAVLLVTHDRYFLDAIATRIVELERGRLSSFPGGYGAYLEKKADLMAMRNASSKTAKICFAANGSGSRASESPHDEAESQNPPRSGARGARFGDRGAPGRGLARPTSLASRARPFSSFTVWPRTGGRYGAAELSFRLGSDVGRSVWCGRSEWRGKDHAGACRHRSRDGRLGRRTVGRGGRDRRRKEHPRRIPGPGAPRSR